MIIKSMARKAPTFDQLIGYIGRSAEPDSHHFARNLYHGGEDDQLVSRQFYENHAFLPRRLNGNALYHEVIVLERSHIPERRQAQILLNLAAHYCELRAPDQLAWGRVHFDTDYPHIHLMISANAARSAKRVRLDKSSFAKIQAEVERFKNQHFPELGSRVVYAKSADRSSGKISRLQGEVKRRTGAASKRDEVRSALADIFAQTKNTSELAEGLSQAGLSLYRRGKTSGVQVIETGRKYRLSTLGLEAEYHRVLAQCKKQASPNQATPPRDARAQVLLKQRESMEQAAHEQLDRFDHERE